MKMIRLYSYRKAESLIETQYGEIPYINWLKREKERIERDPKRFAGILKLGEACCLTVNTAPGCKCEFCGGGKDEKLD